jgi:serine/threonine protein kinase/tetratricopeptide (TPR) repeat protein
MSPGRALPKERAAQQARALEYIYQAETTASGTGTSLSVLASQLGTSDHDANETLIGLVHKGEIVHDPASGEYRLTANGRLEAARRFTLIPGSPPADAHKKTPREADDMTRLPSNDPDDQMTLVGRRPQTSPDEQQTIVGAPPGGSDDGATIVGGGSEPSQGDTGPLSVGERFGTRYRITRLLGVGGMGAVYEAWDGELGVSVALKVIRPEIAGDSNAARELERRFKRELLLARQVTHPNVVRIHDLGEINGIKYITMPYIEGDDLGTILKSEGRLPIPRTLAILRQALSGLVAAHKAGIVHRDLKPANIMVDTEGHALLMDFGIARSIGLPAEEIHKGTSRSKPGSFGETMVGAVVGTIHYMAPEQAKGQTVDHRADIYAFGLILRDTLVGLNRQEGAPTALAELQKRLDAPPVSLKSVDATIPEPLDRIVTRCLAPDPAGRYQTTAELEADLNRLDDQGELIPIKRVLGLPVAVAISLLLVAISSGIWWYFRPPPPPVAHDPVSVVIADLQNNTGDSTFDRLLEPTLKRALETASFVSAYDRAGIRSTLGVRPPEQLDEMAARELAVKQGLNVVLSGSLDRQGNGYGISIKAAETVTGKVIASVKGRASNKDQVLGAATKLVSTVHEALGDDTSESARQFATVTLSTTSLEVVRHHAAAMEAQSYNKLDEALQSYQKAVELDPKFGIGYQGMASTLLNLGKRQEAVKYVNDALRHVDSMTERERFSTRGLYYVLTDDYKACVKEFGDLVSRFPASPAAHNNLAMCLSHVRELPKAADEMRQAIAILPNRLVYRTNLAMFAIYATDFQTAEREIGAIQTPDMFGLLALAFAHLGQGQLPQAKETYQKLETMNALSGLSASRGASGLGDLAVYEGRFSDAVRILEQGANADLTSMNPDRAAAKFASLAYAHSLRKQTAPAIAAAKKALENSQEMKIRFLAARMFVEAGVLAEARKLAAGLAKELQAEPQAYAKILEGEIALKSKDPRQAIKLFSEGNALLDTWIGHFDLGRAYSEASQFTQADSEFDRCIKRRGEAMSLFLDEEPTFGYLPPLYYYQGLAREGMKTEGFRESYRTYLDIRGESTEDPLLTEVRRRVGG